MTDYKITPTLTDAGEWAAQLPPKPVGYWVLYPQAPWMRLEVTYKPTPEQIKNTEELLGWGWRDAP